MQQQRSFADIPEVCCTASRILSSCRCLVHLSYDKNSVNISMIWRDVLSQITKEVNQSEGNPSSQHYSVCACQPFLSGNHSKPISETTTRVAVNFALQPEEIKHLQPAWTNKLESGHDPILSTQSCTLEWSFWNVIWLRVQRREEIHHIRLLSSRTLTFICYLL